MIFLWSDRPQTNSLSAFLDKELAFWWVMDEKFCVDF
jgi:hypothetical protein